MMSPPNPWNKNPTQWEGSNQKVLASPLNTSGDPEVTQMRWLDTSKKPGSVIDYGTSAYIAGTTKNIPNHEQIRIWLYNGGNQPLTYFNTPVINNSFIYAINFNNASSWFNNANLNGAFSCQVVLYDDDLNRHKFTSGKLNISIVKEIRNIMAAQGWQTAVRCQNEWINHPMNTQPSAVPPVTGILTMSWILGFQVANDEFNIIFSNATWKSKEALESLATQIKKMSTNNLISLPQTVGGSCTFGTFSMSTLPGKSYPEIEEYYYQYQARSTKLYDSIDEFLGAIGSLTFHIAAKGKVEKLASGYKIDIEQVGVYVKDSYDFTGSQYLGCWDIRTNTISQFPSPASSGVNIYNSDYQEYQKRTGMGKNYLNYSDVSVKNMGYTFEVDKNFVLKT